MRISGSGDGDKGGIGGGKRRGSSSIGSDPGGAERVARGRDKTQTDRRRFAGFKTASVRGGLRAAFLTV